ncbi:pol protein [Cucumis melo var. makuwa]|uniref:Pol protein n=1 Tax=Cucumis melo var. makuwa TaxID=1194695 RepID=A0A5D3CC37_CUCMM|nr:pol protein [Cucumis melo var. makuwa]
MHFITGLPRTVTGYTVIWVVIDRLTKSAHFIRGESTYTLFWKGLQLALGTRLDFSTTFHPQTDGQTERLNQILEDMLRACVVDLLYVEMRLGEQIMLGPKLGHITIAAIQKIRARMLTAQSKQKSYADERQSFKILERIGSVACRLALPPSFSTVYDVFHVSMLRKYVANLTHVVDFEPLQINENMSFEEQPVEILAREVKMLRNRRIVLVKVLCRNHELKRLHGRERLT